MNNISKNIESKYIVEVLSSFHDVWRPLCLIHLHPAKSQELSEGIWIETIDLIYIPSRG